MALTLLDLESVRRAWQPLIRKLGVRLGVPLSQAERFLAISGPGVLAVRLPQGYNGAALECDSSDSRARIEEALGELLGAPLKLVFERDAGGPETAVAPAVSAAKRRDEVEEDPMVRKVVELFEARPLHLEYDDETR